MATGRIGTTPVLQVRWSKAPNAGTTSLSGTDDNSVTLVYSVGYEAVYRNGVLLSRGNDYTATNGTTVTLVDATIAGDIIEIFANQTVPLTDTYSQSVANGKFINNTLTTTTGDIIYASAANTPARLGIGSTDQVLKVSGGIPAWGAAPAGGSFVGCMAVANANQTISNNTDTAVNFGGTDLYDTDAFHNPSSNSSRITIPSGKGGKYLFQTMIRWDGNTSGFRNIKFYINGTEGQTVYRAPAFTAGACIINVSFMLELVASDFVQIFVFQNSGTSVELEYSHLTSQLGAGLRFGCQYLGA